jgi:hypothetical protein
MDDNRTLLAGIVGSFIADAIHAKAYIHNKNQTHNTEIILDEQLNLHYA